MTGRQKLLEYAKKRSVFRASDVEHELGLSRMYISRLVKDGELEVLVKELFDGRILLVEAVAEFEKLSIQKALERNGSNLTETAVAHDNRRNTLSKHV